MSISGLGSAPSSPDDPYINPSINEVKALANNAKDPLKGVLLGLVNLMENTASHPPTYDTMTAELVAFRSYFGGAFPKSMEQKGTLGDLLNQMTYEQGNAPHIPSGASGQTVGKNYIDSFEYGVMEFARQIGDPSVATPATAQDLGTGFENMIGSFYQDLHPLGSPSSMAQMLALGLDPSDAVGGFGDLLSSLTSGLSPTLSNEIQKGLSKIPAAYQASLGKDLNNIPGDLQQLVYDGQITIDQMNQFPPPYGFTEIDNLQTFLTQNKINAPDLLSVCKNFRDDMNAYNAALDNPDYGNLSNILSEIKSALGVT